MVYFRTEFIKMMNEVDQKTGKNYGKGYIHTTVQTNWLINIVFLNFKFSNGHQIHTILKTIGELGLITNLCKILFYQLRRFLKKSI